MHIVQKPTPGIPAEIEVDFLRRTDVTELGDYGFSILARIRTSDGEIRNGPILSIDPEIKIQAANFALRPLLVVAMSFRSRAV